MNSLTCGADLMLLYQTNEIIDQWVCPEGIKRQFLFDSSLNLNRFIRSSYLIATQKMHLVNLDPFVFERPGGGLIAAKKIKIKAEHIILRGTRLRPIIVIGIESIILEADYIRLSHVTFLTSQSGSFHLQRQSSEIKGTKVGRITLTSDRYKIRFESLCSDSSTIDSSPRSSQSNASI